MHNAANENFSNEIVMNFNLNTILNMTKKAMMKMNSITFKKQCCQFQEKVCKATFFANL